MIEKASGQTVNVIRIKIHFSCWNKNKMSFLKHKKVEFCLKYFCETSCFKIFCCLLFLLGQSSKEISTFKPETLDNATKISQLNRITSSRLEKIRCENLKKPVLFCVTLNCKFIIQGKKAAVIFIEDQNLFILFLVFDHSIICEFSNWK